MVKYRHCSHRFNNRNGTRQHTWVVTSKGGQSSSLTIYVNRILSLQQSRYRFESDTEINVLPIGYSTLYASTMICLGNQNAVCRRHEDVVLLRPALSDPSKTFPIFKALDGIDAKHGSTEGRMQLAKFRFAQACRTALNDAGDHATDRVTLALYLGDEGFISAAFSVSGQRTALVSVSERS